MNRGGRNFNLGSEEFQGLFSFLRLLTIFAILWGFAAFCSTNLHGIDPREYTQAWRERVPLVFGWWPEGLLVFITAAINPFGLRYMIAPAAAMILIFIAGANYVKDIYALKKFKPALDYVLNSMLGSEYPKIVIDKGSIDDPQNTDNLLQKIGGPGYALVEPGSAAIFRHLREPGPVVIGATHFMAPFETISTVVDLDEQQGDKDEIDAISRDGVEVVLKDVHMRYRFRLQVVDGQPIQRTIEEPYPLDPDAFRRMMINLTINPDGSMDKWNVAVERVIVGNITDYIAAHMIDYLTAPRDGTPNPRIELRNELFMTATQRALDNYGAELLWIDVGHLEIKQAIVDDKRADLWASEWISDTTVAKAYTESITQAYQELGRAQAQAELILSIADSLRTASIDGAPRDNIRRLLLARTAQMLDRIEGRKEDQVKND